MDEATVTLPRAVKREDLKTFRARLRAYHQYVALSEMADIPEGQVLGFAAFSDVLDTYDHVRATQAVAQ